MSKYTCPICDKGFDESYKDRKAAGAFCPHCKNRISYKRGRKKIDGDLPELVGWYEPYDLKDVSDEIIIPEEKEELVVSNPVIDINANPIICKLDEKRYIVIYNGGQNEFVRCPECNQAFFINKTLVGELEEKCSRCKSIVRVAFVSGGNISKYAKIIST